MQVYLFSLLGAFIGAFAISLGIAAIWLIIAMLIPPLRKSPENSYITAMVLATGIQFLNIDGIDVIGVMAIIVCNGLLFWQMKRAKTKLARQLVESSSVEP
jgi:hypothetical protein